MELCVMIEGQEGVSWPQWRAIAEACEEHGIARLYRSDHYLPLGAAVDREVLDAWGTICALAAVTGRLRLGTLVSPATFRHPANLAKLAATADAIAPGRITLGLGAGWHEGEHAAYGFPFAPTKDRMSVFAEQLEIVRDLLRGGRVAYAGDHYKVGPVDPLPAAGDVEIVVGGSGGPRSVALAARFADEYNTPFATVERCRELRRVVDAAAAEHGRGSGPAFSLMTGALLGRDDGEVARRRDRLAAKRGEPDWTPGPEWLVGTPDAVRAQVDAFADAGVDRIMVQLLLHDEHDQIALLGALSR